MLTPTDYRLTRVTLRPKLFLAGVFHRPLGVAGLRGVLTCALGTGLHVPYPDMITSALQAQTADLAPVGGGYVCNDTTHDNVLDGLTVRA